MPAIMIAQMECILYTKVLRPMHTRLLAQLNSLVKANKREYWLTIYLTMFILLHSCAMVSRRDWETARQYGLKVELVSPSSSRPPCANSDHVGTVLQPTKHRQASNGG